LKNGAAGENRTHTTVARREILSLLRLPIPPQRLKKKMNEFEMNIIESTPFVKKNVDLKKQIRLFEGSIKQDDKRQK
jgi:hypothetical protein